MNGREGGRSDRMEDMGADRLVDRAIALTREIFDVLRQAERGIDDAVRDLQRAERIERGAEDLQRKGEALERRAEGIEREALGDLTGTTERRERGGDRDEWRGWWGRGDGYMRDIDDGMRRMRDGRSTAGYDGIRTSMNRMKDHMRGYNTSWSGWDDRYRPVFDDWTRRWDALYGRWDGHDWGRGEWRNHDGHFRAIYGDYDGLRNHWNRFRDDWGRRSGWDGRHAAPGTERGGW